MNFIKLLYHKYIKGNPKRIDNPLHDFYNDTWGGNCALRALKTVFNEPVEYLIRQKNDLQPGDKIYTRTYEKLIEYLCIQNNVYMEYHKEIKITTYKDLYKDFYLKKGTFIVITKADKKGKDAGSNHTYVLQDGKVIDTYYSNLEIQNIIKIDYNRKYNGDPAQFINPKFRFI